MATTTPKQKGRNSGKSATPTTHGDHTAPATDASLALAARCVGASLPTMGSREIAALTGKRHDNVMADIRSMLTELVVDPLQFQGIYLDGRNRKQQEFRLPKRETLILVSGYSVLLRTRIIDRWQELEARAAAPAFAIPKSLPDALRLAAELAETNARLEHTVQHQATKVAALDRLAAADGSLNITAAAKSLKVRPKFLFDWLAREQWIYRRGGGAWTAYQVSLMRGVLEHKTTTLHRDDGTDKVVAQVLVTAKGVVELSRKLAGGAVSTQGGAR